MKLATWSTHPVHVRYRREIHWPTNDEDGTDYVLLRLETDDGLVGVAEGGAKPAWNGVTPRLAAAVVEELFVPALREVDLLDEMAVTRALNRIKEHRSVRSMVEAACWDLRAQVRGQPMWQLWGGDPDVPVSWVLTRQTPGLMAQEAGAMVDRFGFRTLKVKTGQGWDVDKAALSEIREAVGADVQIMADANDGYTATEAPDYLKNLAEMGVTYAEDPCLLRPNRAFEKLQAESPIPILVDRASSGAEAAALFLERGAKALSVKTGGTGIGEARRMSELAYEQHCAAHVGSVVETSLGALVALQIHSALPTRSYSLPAETSGFLMLADEYLTERLRVEGGRVRLPATPGHARWVDWERVQSLHPEA